MEVELVSGDRPPKQQVDARSFSSQIRQVLRSTAGVDNILVQAWQPGELDQAGNMCLQTQGCPFALECDKGDRLALYRWRSCHYQFVIGPDAEVRDASSEAYLTRQALLVADWQRDTQSWAAHPRAYDARAAGVSSSVFVPIYDPTGSESGRPVAVLEATQASDAACALPIVTVAEKLCHHVEAVGLSVLAPAVPETYPSVIRQESSNFDNSDVFGRLSSADRSRSQGLDSTHSRGQQDLLTNNSFSVKAPNDSPKLEGATETEAVKMSDAGADEEVQGREAQGPHTRRTRPDQRVRSAPSGPREVSVDDVRQHFSYGLKEAAMRLGVCTTTLKRICRRNGIQRWPRKEMLQQSSTAEEREPVPVPKLPQRLAASAPGAVPLLAANRHGPATGMGNASPLPQRSIAVNPASQQRSQGDVAEMAMARSAQADLTMHPQDSNDLLGSAHLWDGNPQLLGAAELALMDLPDTPRLSPHPLPAMTSASALESTPHGFWEGPLLSSPCPVSSACAPPQSTTGPLTSAFSLNPAPLSSRPSWSSSESAPEDRTGQHTGIDWRPLDGPDFGTNGQVHDPELSLNRDFPSAPDVCGLELSPQAADLLGPRAHHQPGARTQLSQLSRYQSEPLQPLASMGVARSPVMSTALSDAHALLDDLQLFVGSLDGHQPPHTSHSLALRGLNPPLATNAPSLTVRDMY